MLSVIRTFCGPRDSFISPLQASRDDPDVRHRGWTPSSAKQNIWANTSPNSALHMSIDTPGDMDTIFLRVTGLGTAKQALGE